MRILNKNKYFMILIFLMILDCSLGGFIGIWREWYWGALEQKEASKWLLYVGEFSAAALLSCWVSGYSQYVVNIIGLRMRTELTRKALSLTNHNSVEGWTQRVQEDCFAYPLLLVSIISGLIRSSIMIIIFAVLLERL
jgi:ABC-type long-subunit fatty acid transport system fused permease/ATPase subunit